MCDVAVQVETNRNSVIFLEGEYSDNKLNGKGGSFS
jgi:hypothetical protein